MKILKHGNSIKFTCEKCGCVFTELPKVCYSSIGEDGAHYCMSCPECSNTCWTSDTEQQEAKQSERLEK